MISAWFQEATSPKYFLKEAVNFGNRRDSHHDIFFLQESETAEIKVWIDL